MPRKLYPAKRGLLWLSLLAVLICFDVPAGAAGDSDASHGEVEETGTWGGARTWLFDRGIELSMDVTQGVQGVLEGGGDEEADYLGSSELILDVDSEKLGLWPGGFARVAVEGRFGSDVLSEAGTFSPVSNDAVFPSDPDRPGKDLVALTELTATQFFAPWIGIFGGLVNTTSGDANDYAGFLRSNEHFQNISFLGSLASFRVVPSVTLGGGFVVIPFDWLVGSLTFMSTEESAGSDPFETDDGGTFVTEWKVSHDLLKLPVRHVAAFAIGFDNDFFRLGKLPQLELPPDQGPQLRFATKDESWAVWYNGQLDFWNHAEDEERKAGLFFRFGYADDETSFVEWNLAAGIGGTGVFDFRPRDRFGIGIYHIEPSSEYPLPEFGVNEETGFEIFYNAEIWSGVNLTADLQYIDSAFGNGPLVTSTPDNAWVGGLRLRIVL
jgi:porin